MPDRSRVMTQTKRDTLVLQVGGYSSYLAAYEDGTDSVFRNVSI
jgi:hypothetical protein